jgi:succinate dehydrogenase/fumarate reductase flavoprotein subunit
MGGGKGGIVTDYDVVVLGSGLAGTCAALEAAGLGARVLIVEAEEKPGGRSQFSTGMIMGAGTRFQRDKGIEDSPENLFRHYMTLNQWKVDASIVRRLAEEAGPSIEWLAELGVKFLDVYYSGDEIVPRGHVTHGGAAIMEVVLARARLHPGIDLALKQRVDRLLTSDGRVTGVEAGGEQLTAGAVVMATGGIEGNPELIARYLPDAVAAGGDWLWPNGLEPVARYSKGDAFALVSAVSAQITGHNRWLCNLRPNFAHESDPYFPGWLVCVNREGRRFFDEMSPYSVTQPIVLAQDGPLWAVFDDAVKRASQPQSTAQFKKVLIPGMTWEDWVEPVIDEMVEAGKVITAGSIADLARAIGVSGPGLAGTIEKYNADVAAGEDSVHLKKPAVLRPVSTPPFYATEVRLCQLSVTAVGPRVDRDGRVINTANLPVPGLFAAGECVGGVLGDVYVGSGNALANALVFGRVAGRSAALSVPAAVA